MSTTTIPIEARQLASGDIIADDVPLTVEAVAWGARDRVLVYFHGYPDPIDLGLDEIVQVHTPDAAFAAAA